MPRAPFACFILQWTPSPNSIPSVFVLLPFKRSYVVFPVVGPLRTRFKRNARVLDHPRNQRVPTSPFFQSQFQHSYLAMYRLNGFLRHIRSTDSSQRDCFRQRISLHLSGPGSFPTSLYDAHDRRLLIGPHDDVDRADTLSRARMPRCAPRCMCQSSCKAPQRPSSFSSLLRGLPCTPTSVPRPPSAPRT